MQLKKQYNCNAIPHDVKISLWKDPQHRITAAKQGSFNSYFLSRSLSLFLFFSVFIYLFQKRKVRNVTNFFYRE